MTESVGEFRVVGANTSDGHLHSWYFATATEAHSFAHQLARDNRTGIAEVMQFLGRYERRIPVEYVSAKAQEPS